MLNNKEYLNKIFQSNKPLIIYKTIGGYDVYTDFKEKITLNSKNFKNFLNKKTLQSKSPIKELNCYIGFFGFQLLCESIKIKIPKQQSLNFYPGLVYKPQTIIKIRKNIVIKSLLKITIDPYICQTNKYFGYQNRVAKLQQQQQTKK